jgi:hypothetical protein
MFQITNGNQLFAGIQFSKIVPVKRERHTSMLSHQRQGF